MRRSAKSIKKFVVDELLDGMPLIGDPLSDGRLDSLAIEQLIAFLEETYDLDLQDEDLGSGNFGSLEAVARFVDEQRRLRQGRKQT